MAFSKLLLLMTYYEELESKAHFGMAVAFLFMGMMILVSIFMIAAEVTVWWVFLIPAFACMILGFVFMAEAAYARDAIEGLRWRMI